MGVNESAPASSVNVDERGYFWWSHEPKGKHASVPNTAVSGRLSIDSTARIELALDGMLPGERDSPIIGVLRDGKQVILLDPWPTGPKIRFPGISTASFQASRCLVGQLPRGLKGPTAHFRKI